MGLRRLDNLLLKHYRVLVAFCILGILLLSIFLPTYSFFVQAQGDLGKEINPAIINGILTVSAIVFGFVVFEIREIEASIYEKFGLMLPLLIFLMLSLQDVFLGAVAGKVTSGTALLVTINCLFFILYVLPLLIVKQSRTEIRQRKEQTES